MDVCAIITQPFSSAEFQFVFHPTSRRLADLAFGGLLGAGHGADH
jgi:hypothetical protein